MVKKQDKVYFEFDGAEFEANIEIKYHEDSIDEPPGVQKFTVIDEVKILGLIDDQGTLIEPTEKMIELINEKAAEKI